MSAPIAPWAYVAAASVLGVRPHAPSRQDGPWNAPPPKPGRTRTWGRFQALRDEHPDWSTARIRRAIHDEVLAAGPAVKPEPAR